MSFLNILAAADPVAKAEAVKENVNQRLELLSQMSFNDLVHTLITDLIQFGIKILVAILIFIVGRFLIRYLLRMMGRIMEKKDVDLSLRTFLRSLASITLHLILIIILIGAIGLQTSSFVAVFASAGVAIGLALSGTLQNFAGGVLILLLKPFRVGDFIEAQGQSGTVKEIQLFNTILNTPDNKTIMVPNGATSTGIINNYSKAEMRRVDWLFGIAYGDNYDKAKEIITRLLEEDQRVLRDPEWFIALHSLGDSSVNIVVRAWVSTADYWGVYFDMNEKIYKTFGQEGINIPFPQMDVHMNVVGGNKVS